MRSTEKKPDAPDLDQLLPSEQIMKMLGTTRADYETPKMLERQRLVQSCLLEVRKFRGILPANFRVERDVLHERG